MNFFRSPIYAWMLFFSSLCAAPTDSWKGDEYAKHSESQKSSADDFIKGFNFQGVAAVLDVGCGDGKITAAMARALPNGKVVGVDISPSMIDFARAAFPGDSNLSFLVQDAARIDFFEKFDLITSFTVMQWVLEQSQALDRFAKALKPGGRLCIQMPTEMPAAMRQALDQTLSSEKWKEHFAQFSPPWRFYQPEEYRSLLEAAHFSLRKLETYTKYERFPSRAAFQGFLKQWFPYLRPLPDALKDEFLTEFVDAYLQILPADDTGQVSFIVTRLEVEAEKPTSPPVAAAAEKPAENSNAPAPPPAPTNPPVPCDEWWFWAGAEYLYWEMKGSAVPVPLVATGRITADGAPLVPRSTTVLGCRDYSLGGRSGARFCLAGMATHHFGLEATYFMIPSKSRTKQVYSSGQGGSPFYTIPFIDATTGSPSSTQIALPGYFAGAARLKITNDMQSAEGDFLGRVYCKGPVELNVCAGFKWWNLKEHLTFVTSSPNVPPFTIDVFQTKDSFTARNNFYGGLVGLDAAFTWNWFFFEATGKVSLGSMRSALSVNGSFVTNDFGPLQTFPSGYFAQLTNEGTATSSTFAVLPEANLNFAFQATDYLAFEFGYTFLYVNRVLWAGDGIDDRINPTQSPAISGNPSAALSGPARPKPVFNVESLWAQGVSAGFGFDY